jgi:hypothetical protein
VDGLWAALRPLADARRPEYSYIRCSDIGGRTRARKDTQVGREVTMRLVRRVTIAVGSLFAMVVTGGAHLKW